MSTDEVRFTFHHVSIKTPRIYDNGSNDRKFTFHHVSIKTDQPREDITIFVNSHSTMYLLKQKTLDDEGSISLEFTFHHVSIKTNSMSGDESIEVIHIPPCIY